MSLAATEFRADLAEAIADLPVTCLCGGVSFTAASSEDSGTREIEVDGELIEVDRQIVTDAYDLPAAAVKNATVTVGGKAYRIMSINEHPDGVGVEIALKATVR
jgi:hypothetical protein